MKKLYAFIASLAISTAAFGQAISTNGGAIQGTITDPSGAVVPNASVTISSPDTGFSRKLTTDSAGYYSVGPLVPGNYVISVSAPSFSSLDVKTVVRTGTVTTGSEKLKLGTSGETIEVNAGSVQVNTEQIAVSDVITREQIDTLPVNGRNFLDLAQIEPGVILQSGESFDPTKAGYSAISVSGVSGRTTRILLDGQDITDEFVGTTIVNVSQGSVNEFQLNRATQDASGDVTSTGQVLVSTRSGTNQFHGQVFYNFQDHRALFARSQNGIDAPFQRNQFGGGVGGPIIKDKLFFFGNSERIKQDSSGVSPVLTGTGSYFGAIAAAHPTIPSPFRDTYSTVRLDYNGPFGGHYFARAYYEVNSVASNYGYGYWLYANRDNTPGIVGGADFQQGHFTHSIRYGYEKFHNLISDKTTGNTSVYNGIPGFSFYNSAQGLYSGPNYLAPQATYQSDKQARYDGSWTKGAHTIRFGYSLNRIQAGGFASFFGLSPRVSESIAYSFNGVVSSKFNPTGAGCGGVVGAAPCPTDPINGYHPQTAYIGNELGGFTEKPAFGLSGGGVADWRSGAYVGDTWKVLPSLTVTAALRWSVDTDRANQDVPMPDCSTLDTANFYTAPSCPRGQSILQLFDPSLGGRAHQPYGNFSPQAGFVFSPGAHKISFHGGAGIYYESDVFNNTTNARLGLLQHYTGNNEDYASASSGPKLSYNAPGGVVLSSATVGGVTKSVSDIINTLSIAQAAPFLNQLQSQYAALYAASAASGINGQYVGETLDAAGIYSPNYRTPYSIQLTGGVQQEIHKGAVLSVDFVHNATLKIQQSLDYNNIGAARYLQTGAATTAITGVTSSYGCVGGATAAAINCSIAAGATISDFAGNGIDAIPGGLPITYGGASSGSPVTAGYAFAGKNPLLGSGAVLAPIGKSAYDALQVVYRQQSSHPLPGIMSSNLQVSYTLSRAISTASSGSAGDQFFSSSSYDNDRPTAFMGRNSLDRSNELSMGGSFLVKYGPRFSFLGHFYSARPNNLTLLTSGSGGVLQSDLTGDGTINDIAPGTTPGSYMHSIKPKDLPGYIANFNATQAGKITPAGQALIAAGLFTQAQLVAIGATVQPLAQVNSYAPNNPAFESFDLSASYPINHTLLHFLPESVSLEPSITFYNAFNFATFSGAPYSSSLRTVGDAGVKETTAGYLTSPLNNTTLNNYRVQRGSGTFDQGGPRSTEFQLKLNF